MISKWNEKKKHLVLNNFIMNSVIIYKKLIFIPLATTVALIILHRRNEWNHAITRFFSFHKLIFSKMKDIIVL